MDLDKYGPNLKKAAASSFIGICALVVIGLFSSDTRIDKNNPDNVSLSLVNQTHSNNNLFYPK